LSRISGHEPFGAELGKKRRGLRVKFLFIVAALVSLADSHEV
jgi:hypothetical protein